LAAALLVATLAAGSLAAGLGAGRTVNGAAPVGSVASTGSSAALPAALPVARLAAAITPVTPYDNPTPAYEVSPTGAVWPLGGARSYGQVPPSAHLSVVGVTMTPDDGGYWLVTSAGGVYNFGDTVVAVPPVMAYVHTVLTAGDAAVEWAMAQLGKPYAWGGTGPSSFDCSGLTMEAWLAARVDIPRIADDQYIAEPRVALTNLVDGDLVFWASTAKPTSIYHVAMYLGAGRIVQAPNTGHLVSSTTISAPRLVAAASAP
jgi:hypothetical protein